jgi:hypothetical protein
VKILIVVVLVLVAMAFLGVECKSGKWDTECGVVVRSHKVALKKVDDSEPIVVYGKLPDPELKLTPSQMFLRSIRPREE